MGGVLITPLPRILHPKGDILHAMKCSSPGFSGFGEAYFSMISPGEVKGWKRHLRATLNLVVPVGAVQFVIHDSREETIEERFASIVMGPLDRYARLTVPPGLWVAFKGVGSPTNMLLNISDEEHDPKEADNAELGSISYPW